MLGASSSEEDDDDVQLNHHEDEVHLLLQTTTLTASCSQVSRVYSIAPSGANDAFMRGSGRSASPDSFQDRVSITGSVKMGSVVGMGGHGGSVSAASGCGQRPPSPSPSAYSAISHQVGPGIGNAGPSTASMLDSKLSKEETERIAAEQEEEERKQKLQLYVFVAKCIAYHFNAKQPTDMARRSLLPTPVLALRSNPNQRPMPQASEDDEEGAGENQRTLPNISSGRDDDCRG